MKRLTLEAFKAQNINKITKQATDKLLGQVLGDCHDDHGSGGGDRGGYNVGEIGSTTGFPN